MMGILTGKQEPLHYGELHGVWESVLMGKGLHTAYVIMRNHAGDEDLKEFITTQIKGMEMQIKGGEEILKENGLTSPPSPPERPVIEWKDIPEGGRFYDPEIAFSTKNNIAAGLGASSMMIAKCLNDGVRKYFEMAQKANTEFYEKIIHLMKEKAWLTPPPLQVRNQEE